MQLYECTYLKYTVTNLKNMLSAARLLSRRLPAASAVGQTRSMGGSQSFVSVLIILCVVWFHFQAIGNYICWFVFF